MTTPSKVQPPSLFVISLDFELMWGVFDKRSIAEYGDNIKGVHTVIPKILAVFRQFGIHATWAAVGCLYYKTLEELLGETPGLTPTYTDDRLSAYSHMKTITPESFPDYYSGSHLIDLISSTPGQEVATHTFSHYYCLEQGQDPAQFKSDIHKAVEKAAARGLKITSIIFPRNQYDQRYLDICREAGINCYRGNEDNFLQRPRSQKELSSIIRALRLADTYINITGSNIYHITQRQHALLNIPASFFFRPFNPRLKWLEKAKVSRYKKAMLDAARSGKVCHIWWHPHNFGKNQTENLEQLAELLNYYQLLNKDYGMESCNMREVAEKIRSL